MHIEKSPITQDIIYSHTDSTCTYARIFKIPIRQTDRETDRQRDRKTERQTNRETDKQTDKQTDRQTNRDRQAHKQKDRHQVCSSIDSGSVPTSVSSLISASKLIALKKPNGNVRRIVIGEA